MSVKGSISLQFNGISWRAVPLGEQALLLEAPEGTPLHAIHGTCALLEDLIAEKMLDLVPAYRSIAIFTDLDFELLLARLARTKQTRQAPDKKKEDLLEVPVCYEAGLDLEAVSRQLNLPKEEVIERHLAQAYTCAFIGFTPGFIYADGLDQTLACPRKSEPRKNVPEGSVGIGGSQTGIYSLASPGGWNIIGRTPLSLFDSEKTPPILLSPGQPFRFHRITKKEFEAWEK